MYPLSSGQSAKLTDCVLNIHSAYQLITTEWYNPKNQWAMRSESIFHHPKLPILVSIYQRDLTVRPMEHPFILSSIIIWSVFYNLAMSAKQITVIIWPICSLESLETRPFVKKKLTDSLLFDYHLSLKINIMYCEWAAEWQWGKTTAYGRLPYLPTLWAVQWYNKAMVKVIAHKLQI